MNLADELGYALRRALRFAASRSTITSVEEKALLAAWNTRATEPTQDCEAAWKKLREYCTNGLPFYDNHDGWRTIANAVLRAAEPAHVRVTPADREAAVNFHGSGWMKDLELVAKGIAQGRAEAAAEIVAWMRRQVEAWKAAAKAQRKPVGGLAVGYKNAANAIEAGDHRKEGA